MMPTTFRASAFNLATFCCCRCAYSGAVESIKIATISSRFINSPGPPTLCECRVYAIRLFAFVLLGIIEHEARGRRGLGAAVDQYSPGRGSRLGFFNFQSSRTLPRIEESARTINPTTHRLRTTVRRKAAGGQRGRLGPSRPSYPQSINL